MDSKTHKLLDVLVDLGAATSVMKHSSIGAAIKYGMTNPSRFTSLIAANGLSNGKILGRAPVDFSFSEDGPVFTHEVTVLDSQQVPGISW